LKETTPAKASINCIFIVLGSLKRNNLKSGKEKYLILKIKPRSMTQSINNIQVIIISDTDK
jgi:hypothetical protein